MLSRQNRRSDQWTEWPNWFWVNRTILLPHPTRLGRASHPFLIHRPTRPPILPISLPSSQAPPGFFLFHSCQPILRLNPSQHPHSFPFGHPSPLFLSRFFPFPFLVTPTPQQYFILLYPSTPLLFLFGRPSLPFISNFFLPHLIIIYFLLYLLLFFYFMILKTCNFNLN